MAKKRLANNIARGVWTDQTSESIQREFERVYAQIDIQATAAASTAVAALPAVVPPSDQDIDGGRADTVYGGELTIDAGGA